MVDPYYQDDAVTLYLGDCRQILPRLDAPADCIVADPPYEATSHPWDQWPDGWLCAAQAAARSLWCFLPLRQFAEPPYRGIEFRAAGWRMSQDIAWEKHLGSGFATDRFARVHETVTHWYQPPWGGIYHQTPRLPAQFDAKGRTTSARADDRAAHTGRIKARSYVDDGLRLARTVQRIPSVRRGQHRTEKPARLLDLLIAYACPPGGLVIDPFAGSGSTLDAARQSGRRAIGIEAHEPYAERAAKRLTREAQPA